MTATIINSDDFPTEVRVFEVGNDSESRADADLILDGDDLTNLESTDITVTRRIQEWKDVGKFSFKSSSVPDDNPLDAVTGGDRLEFWASFTVGDEEAGGFGEGGFGEGGFGGGPAVYSDRRWTAYAHAPSAKAAGPGDIAVSFEATDFVFEIMSSRLVTNAWADEEISGSSDAIVETMLTDNCSEIDQSKIEDVETTTSREFDARPVKEAVFDLSETADALMASKGTSLIFKPFDDIAVKHDFGWEDVQGDVDVVPDDGELINDWRIDGGVGTELDEVQETVDSYTTVTEDSPITYELDPEKNELDRMDVYTRKTGSEEEVRVRIQAPNSAGDGPRDASDTTKDIVGDKSPAEFLDADGWRERFKFRRKTLPDNPWLIIDSGGSTGQDIGVNSDGDPAFRSYYPYPINVKVNDQDSIDEYRRREGRIKQEILASFDAARDVGDSRLRHSADPDSTISCTARTSRAHLLDPGEVVNVDFSPLATGNYIVFERSDTYSAVDNLLQTDLTLVDLDTI